MRHLPCTPVYPSKPERVNTVRVTKFKVFLSFIHPTPSECCIQVAPCHIMRYWELNTNILSTFSGLSLSDGIYVFPKFCLRLFSTIDILQNFPIKLFDSTWCYFDLVGISFNVMYYFNQIIDRLTHCNCVIIVIIDGEGNKAYFKVQLLVPCRPVLLEPFKVLLGAIRCDTMRNELWDRSATASLNIIPCVVLNFSWLILRYSVEGWIVHLCLYYLLVLFWLRLPLQ